MDYMNVPYPDFVQMLCKPGEEIHDEMTGVQAHLTHMAIGVAGEASELLEPIVNHTVYFQILDRKNVIEELGDLEFFLEGIRGPLGLIRGGLLSDDEEPKIDGTISIAVYGPKVLIDAIKLSIAGGKLLDAVKQSTIYQKNLPMQELTDAMTTITDRMASIRRFFGISRKTVLEANRAKLAKRWGKLMRYSNAAAQARADKA